MQIHLTVAAAALAIAPFAHAQSSQPLPLWGALQPGPHAVGFRVVYRLDRSRVWDLADTLRPEGSGRPVRVSIWYPASRGSGRAMRYRDYVYMPQTRGVFARLDSLLLTRDTASRRGAFAGAEKHISDLLALPVLARFNATAAPGNFPLVMYSDGWNSSTQHSNTVLAEYLASHGFVVALVPQVGRSPNAFALGLTQPELEIQMRDIEFAIGVVYEMPTVNRGKLSLVGWSMGGVVSLLLSGRNPNVDAVVGLDASFRARDWIGLTMGSPYFSLRDLRASLLALQSGHPKSVPGQSDAVIDSLHFMPRYIGQVSGVMHGDFSDFPAIARLYPVAVIDRTPADAARGHDVVIRAVHGFLSGVSRADKTRLASLSTLDTTLLTLTQRPAVVIPTEAEWIAILESRSVAAAIEHFRSLQRANPSLTILDQRQTTRRGYALLREKRPEAALGLFQLLVAAYPASADAFDSLADAFLARGDSAGAQSAYEKVLELLPADTSIAPNARQEYQERATRFIAARKPDHQ